MHEGDPSIPSWVALRLRRVAHSKLPFDPRIKYVTFMYQHHM